MSRTAARLDDATIADVGAQNTIRVYVRASDGLWHARVGPDHAPIETAASSADQALVLLMLKIKQAKYRFDHHSVLDLR